MVFSVADVWVQSLCVWEDGAIQIAEANKLCAFCSCICGGAKKDPAHYVSNHYLLELLFQHKYKNNFFVCTINICYDSGCQGEVFAS